MWYSRVVANLGNIPDFIAHYERELAEAKRECKISGYVEVNIKELPGITEHRFNQLQEIEAVLNFLHIQLRRYSCQNQPILRPELSRPVQNR